MAKQRHHGHQSCGKHQEKLSEIPKIGGNIRGKTSIGRVVDAEYMVRKDNDFSLCIIKQRVSPVLVFVSMPNSVKKICKNKSKMFNIVGPACLVSLACL